MLSRNQHLIKTSIPTARAYLPPSSGVNTLIAQHACPFLNPPLDSLRLNYRLGNGTIDTVPILSVAEGELHMRNIIVMLDLTQTQLYAFANL
jgi:hypothetical protein